VTLAYLTNGEGSVIILIAFSAIAATVILTRLSRRGPRRESREQAQPSLLERIEAMTDEEFEAWRAEGRRQYEAGKKQQPTYRRRYPPF